MKILTLVYNEQTQEKSYTSTMDLSTALEVLLKIIVEERTKQALKEQKEKEAYYAEIAQECDGEGSD
jgi:hypothetical protein